MRVRSWDLVSECVMDCTAMFVTKIAGFVKFSLGWGGELLRFRRLHKWELRLPSLNQPSDSTR